jgi:hypothetical protein
MIYSNIFSEGGSPCDLRVGCVVLVAAVCCGDSLRLHSPPVGPSQFKDLRLGGALRWRPIHSLASFRCRERWMRGDGCANTDRLVPFSQHCVVLCGRNVRLSTFLPTLDTWTRKGPKYTHSLTFLWHKLGCRFKIDWGTENI